LLRSVGVAALLASFAVSFGACSANKNYEERQRFAEQNRDRYPDTTFCVDTCTPDPGSRPVDCEAAERGVEFMDPPLFSFEDNEGPLVSEMPENAGDPVPPPTLRARDMYTYTDGSEDFVVPRGYLPDVSDAVRCGASQKVFHIQGGLFRGWGGGMGIGLTHYVETAPLCSDPASNVACVKPDAEFGNTLDASRWDGVSFWARRGPGSQAEIRVVAGDKYTDDDYNVADHRYCRILRTCDCQNHKPCTTYDYVPLGPDGMPTDVNPTERSRCFDPEVDPPPPQRIEDERDEGVDQETGLYERCGTFRCDEDHPTDAPSPLTAGRACAPYTFQSGETRDVCYDPGEDPAPAEGHEVCGDHWTRTVVLGLDWEFFMVPFSSMRQQGYGKESPKLLTDELSVFRFTWDGGWIDYWIDDVRFYRATR